jgi:hypothetical protein
MIICNKEFKKMITKSGFTFNLKSNPRTEDGGFGPLRCTLCKGKTTMLLQITDLGNNEYDSTLTVCKGCLSWMIELIDSAIIDEIKNKDVAKEITSYILETANTESFMRVLMGQEFNRN